MKSLKIIMIMIAAAAVALSGCGRRCATAGDKVLAKVGNKAVTLNELNSRIAKMPAQFRNMVEKNKRRYLDDMIVEEIFYEEAVRKGLERDREVKEIINEAKKKIIIAKFIKTEVEEKVRVGEDEMKEFYEANKENFKTAPMWRASHILVANEKEAEDLAAQLKNGASFEELARTHSTDATSSRGGDIGYFRTGQLVPDFETAALKLKVGETSGVVRTQFGYHIIRLTDIKEPSVENFDKVKRIIEGDIKRKRRGELFNSLVTRLKETYGVRIEEDAVKSLESADKDEKASE